MSVAFPGHQNGSKNAAGGQEIYLTIELEGIKVWWGCGSVDTPSVLLRFKQFCCLTDYQTFSYNCSLFVNTSFDAK